MKRRENDMEKATFAAGCFWHVQQAFSKLYGVVSTTAGYAGGDEKKYPKVTYNQVCSGKTGYAEAVQIEFDPKKVSYEELLRIFWRIHDPTTLNRQGADVGTNYRSAIFYRNKKQKEAAEKSRKETQMRVRGIIVTEISPAGKFVKAEEYHQNYLERHKGAVC